MSKADIYSNLTHLGGITVVPESPENTVLEGFESA